MDILDVLLVIALAMSFSAVFILPVFIARTRQSEPERPHTVGPIAEP